MNNALVMNHRFFTLSLFFIGIALLLSIVFFIASLFFVIFVGLWCIWLAYRFDKADMEEKKL